jgi:tetraacyldisaccharide 4'-kinase
MLKEPNFWYHNSLVTYLLLPLSILYRLGFLVNKYCKQILCQQSHIKIICIGNVTIGGAGKTPTALHIAGSILASSPGAKLCFISKGYKGKASGPVMIRSDVNLDPKLYGDEPILLARVAPVIVAKNRRAGIRYAIKQGFELVVLDDGMQDYSVHKDYTILVIDGKSGVGNWYMLPAGPLRQPVVEGIKQADHVIIMGEDKHDLGKVAVANNKSVTYSNIVPQITEGYGKVIAFAGIGKPHKFFDTMHKLGAQVVKEVVFPDHHYYSKHDISQLEQLAVDLNAQLVTTEKDYIKLPLELRQKVKVVPIKIKLASGDIIQHIKDKLCIK